VKERVILFCSWIVATGCAARQAEPPRIAPSEGAPLRAARGLRQDSSTSVRAESSPSDAPAQDPDDYALRELRHARSLFETFIEKAGDDPKFAEAVRRSHDRVSDIAVMIDFIERGREERARGAHVD